MKWIVYGFLMAGYGSLFAASTLTFTTPLAFVAMTLIVGLFYGTVLLVPFYLTLKNARWYTIIPLGVQFSFLALVFGLLTLFWISPFVDMVIPPDMEFALRESLISMDPVSLNIGAALILGIYMTVVSFMKVGKG